ncbi:MAG: hypothetical protein JXA09_03640 [Anaerolineae bacterium]|nr:hypothetical protein [Anaerolineae bacterium]
MSVLTSRERMLRAIDCRPVDHVPCCFMSFAALRARCDEDRSRVVLAEQEMGLDVMLFIPQAPRRARPEHPDLRGLPVRFDPRVATRTWREGETLRRTYLTPAGALTTGVRLSADWPHGDRLPFVDDYQVPRATTPLVSRPKDLDALRYLLVPPGEGDIAAYAREAVEARAFCAAHGVLLAGGWGVGYDMANWLCGMQDLMLLMMEQPAFVARLLALIHEWNIARMAVVLAGGVDLYIRRAWYEGCDFVTPAFYRQAILPGLEAEARLAHAHGARFGYICSSGLEPMLDALAEAGVDVLIGIDPVQDTRADLDTFRRALGGKVCLWGGVSGAVTVEMGTPQEVHAAVRRAIDALGPDGFILSPVDNLTVDAPRTWENVDVLIEAWRTYR